MLQRGVATPPCCKIRCNVDATYATVELFQRLSSATGIATDYPKDLLQSIFSIGLQHPQHPDFSIEGATRETPPEKDLARVKFTVQHRIRLTAEQSTSLRREAKRRGISISEVLQDILDDHERRTQRRQKRSPAPAARQVLAEWLVSELNPASRARKKRAT